MAAITGNKRKGFTFRMGAISAAAVVTVDDRQPLERRLDELETAGSIDDPENWKQGLETRLTNLEAVNW